MLKATIPLSNFFFLKKGALVYHKPLFYKRTPLPIPETATVRPELPEGENTKAQQSRRQTEPWQHPWPPPRRPGLSSSSSCCSAPPSPSALQRRTGRTPADTGFRPDIAASVVRPLLHFLNGTNSYYFVDAYPYFVWAGNNLTVPLDYALFQGGHTRYVDPGTGLTYTNLLDEMLDAVAIAMAKLGYGGVKLAVAETGWPNGCDYGQIGGNVHNAAIYNRNLGARMAKNPGTPLRPGAKMPVFVFSLYNEDLKGGPGTERHWGLYYANCTAVYEIDLTGRRPLWSYPPLPAPENNTPYKGPIWCVMSAAASKKLNETAVGNALSYACGQGNGTCDAIQPGKNCYLPNTTVAHASYAFNSYWQQFRKTGATCYFNNLAEQTIKDPSHGSCKFRSSLDS